MRESEATDRFKLHRHYGAIFALIIAKFSFETTRRKLDTDYKLDSGQRIGRRAFFQYASNLMTTTLVDGAAGAATGILAAEVRYRLYQPVIISQDK